MALLGKRRFGFGRFRLLVATTCLVLQCAVVGCVDASDSQLMPPILQWACRPDTRSMDVEDATIDVFAILQGAPQAYKLFGLCNRFRGGSLEQTGVASLPPRNMTEPGTALVDDPKPDFSDSPYAFTLFQKNDGSQDDPDGIPTRYLKMQNSKREQAKKALDATLRWRASHDIDTILARPHPKFDVCKRVFPHYFCGRDNTNHVILLQRPGLIDLSLAQANGLTGDDLLDHYVYEMEYLWQILEPTADATMTSIIDLTGLNLSVLTKRELLNVVQKFCSTMDAHFPQRSHKTLLINAPKWFGGIYKIISPLLRESTKMKISILSKGKKQEEALRNLLAQCPINSKDKLEDIPPSEMENDLRSFCVARLEDSGIEMQPVIS